VIQFEYKINRGLRPKSDSSQSMNPVSASFKPGSDNYDIFALPLEGNHSQIARGCASNSASKPLIPGDVGFFGSTGETPSFCQKILKHLTDLT